MRPHGADVVADRVVGGLVLGHRPDAPTGEELGAHEVAHDGRRLVVFDDAAPEEVADVGGDGVDLPPVAVAGEREAVAVRHPEVAVEPSLEARRLPLELVGERRVVPELRARAARSASSRRTRNPGSRSIARGRLASVPSAEDNRVPRVLPALVLEPRLLLRSYETYPSPSAISVLVDPGERRARLELERADEVCVAAPELVFVEEDEEERGRRRPSRNRGSAGARGTRSSLQREIRGGSSRAPRRGNRRRSCLARGQVAERRARELGTERQHLEAREDAVAPEDRHEPRQPGRGQ